MAVRTKKKAERKRQEAPTDAMPGAAARRGTWLLLLTILVTAGISYLYVFDQKLDLGGDNAAYYLLGKGLASGAGYTNIWTPEQSPARHFPPGYPAIVAAVLLVADGILAVKIVNGLLFLGSLVLLYLLFLRFKVDPLLAGVACLAVAVNAHLLRYATIIMSEIPFLFFAVLALYLTTRVEKEEQRPYRDPALYGVLLCLGAAYYIRSIGLALVFGILVYFVLAKAWRHALWTALGFALLALPWYVRGQMLGGSTYASQFTMVNPYRPDLGTIGPIDLVQRVFKNLVRYVSVEFPSGIFPFLERAISESAVLGWGIGLVVLGLIAYGVWRLPAYRTLVFGYLLGTFGITLLWPDVWFGVRFIIGIIPLLVFLVFFGLAEGIERLRPSRGKTTFRLKPLLLLPALLMYLPPLGQQHERAEMNYPSNWLNYFNAAAWVRANTPPGSVVSTRKPEFFYLFAERPTTGYAYSRDDQEVIRGLEEDRVDYVIVDQLGFSSTRLYLVPAIQKNQNRFRMVHQLENPDTFVMAFVRSPETPAP